MTVREFTPEQKARRAYTSKQRRMRLMAEHKCIDCMAIDERTLSGKTRCEACAEKARQRGWKPRTPEQNADMREWRAMQKKYHICIGCGEQDAYTLNGRTYCAECAAREAARKRETRDNEKNRADAKSYRDMWRAEGRCTRCGHAKGDDGHMTCPACRAYNHQRKVETRMANYPRGGNGLCFQCNKRPVRDGSRLCEECYAVKLVSIEKARKSVSLKDHYWRKDEDIRRQVHG